jgi:hypothetical protein
VKEKARQAKADMMKGKKLSELKQSDKLKGLVPDVPSFDEYY